MAVKIISNKNIKNNREKHQVQREREILLRLKHPNIVNLLKVVDDEKREKTFMIFEYVAGGELFDYIVAHGRLTERDARRFMRQARRVHVGNAAHSVDHLCRRVLPLSAHCAPRPQARTSAAPPCGG